jgi:hypothetical protein
MGNSRRTVATIALPPWVPGTLALVARLAITVIPRLDGGVNVHSVVRQLRRIEGRKWLHCVICMLLVVDDVIPNFVGRTNSVLYSVFSTLNVNGHWYLVLQITSCTCYQRAPNNASSAILVCIRLL